MGSSGSSQLKQQRSNRQREPEELPEVYSSFLNTFKILPLSNRPDNTPTLKSLFSRARRLNVTSAGSWIFHKGDPARGIFIVLEGTVEVCLEESDGTAIVIKTLRSGACFGELSTLFSVLCSASVRTSSSE
jgi:CRP-like cAMP-binding protein